MCDDEFLLDLIKSCPYFGSFLGYIGFSYISDNFGRRTTMIMSLGLAMIGSLLIVLSYNLGMVAVGVILAGGGINVSAGIVFYFLG
jgi:MFS family permease